MLDNSMVRFTLMLVVTAVLYWAIRRFFSGWTAQGDYGDYDGVDDIESSHEPMYRSERSEARIQQPLEAPEPDSMMAEPSSHPQQDIARRIRADSQAIDRAGQSRPSHAHPRRNSQPARRRKIQL